ncbi:MAG TPA: S8 family serine peptidase [Blastocatellia bacterium]|nr:S8 family serine peptidase [Blastocatellia bacterium]
MKRIQTLFLALALTLLTLLPMSQASALKPARRAQGYAPGEIIIKLKAGVAQSQTGGGQDHLMAYARSLGEREFGLKTRSIEPIAGRTANERVSEIISARGLDRIFLLKLDPESDIESVIADLKQSPAIEYAEPNYRVETASLLPNDQYFSRQWPLRNLGIGVDGQPSYLDADIKATHAWDISLGSPDVIIAVTDTGIDMTHPDLARNIYTNPGEVPGNGIDDDRNGYVDDVHGYNVAEQNPDVSDVTGHGTQMSGIIAAEINNGIGISGVSQSKIMPVRFFKKTGPDPEDFDATVADAARSLLYSIAAGAHIINASWRTLFIPGLVPESHAQALRDAVTATNDAGALLVCIAGNDGFNNDFSKVYPGAFQLPNQIVVAASDYADDLWHPVGDFFTIKTGFGVNSVHLTAPGVFVLTTLARGNCLGCSRSENPEDWYDEIDGTSASAAFVSGVAALVKSKYPSDHAVAIKRRILEGVDKLDRLQPFIITGGRLNATGAITVEPNFSRPVLSQVKYKNGNGKMTITGTGFVKGAVIAVGRSLYKAKVKGQNQEKVVATVPASALPQGTPVEIRVINPDGGSSPPFTLTR